MSPLVRRTTIVAVALALATAGCAGKKKTATPTPAASLSSTPTPTSAAPAGESPSPSASATSTAKPAPRAKPTVAAAKKLLVTGEQLGEGWDEVITEDLEPDEDDDLCANDRPAGRPRELWSVTSDVTNAGSTETTFQHEVIAFAVGQAAAAVADVDALLKKCEPIVEEGVEYTATSTGPGQADITLRINGDKAFGAFRYEARGDYVSAVVAIDTSAAAARALADRAMAAARENFDAAGIS